MLVGAETQNFAGSNPILTVAKAIGVFCRRKSCSGIADRNLSDFDIPGAPAATAGDIQTIPHGEYMNVITGGTFAAVNADASAAAINIGDKLTLSATPGVVRRWDSDAGQPIVGVALDNLGSGVSKIKIYLTINNVSVVNAAPTPIAPVVTSTPPADTITPDTTQTDIVVTEPTTTDTSVPDVTTAGSQS
jgi:hypothetical protein